MRHLILTALLTMVAHSGCDGPSSSRNGDADDDGAGTDSDTDSDVDSDTDIDSDTDGDTDYPPGPYGFAPSASYEDTFGPVVWTGEGDVIPDVCLPNALGDEVCLGDYFDSPTHELLFVDFTTMW